MCIKFQLSTTTVRNSTYTLQLHGAQRTHSHKVTDLELKIARQELKLKEVRKSGSSCNLISSAKALKWKHQ